MLQPVSGSQYKINFSAGVSESEEPEVISSRILPNTLRTRIRQNSQKVENAFVYYPIRGLQGNVNSDFYEFLTMGIVPYVIGSGTLMLLFNAAKPSVFGKKMALGVLFYGILKHLSQGLVTRPVKAATGVDTEMPYEYIVYALPTEAGANANIDVKYQHRKIFDSKEFYRKDLLKKDYFDKVAMRLGLGTNLNDSESEVSPIIQNIVSTTTTAKRLSSYGWAAVGVGLAVQDCWKDFFNTVSNRQRFVKNKDANFFKNIAGRLLNTGKNTLKISASLIKTFFKSIGQMWKGKDNYNGFMKHSGKLLILLATLMTTALTSNVIIKARRMAKNDNQETIDRTKDTTVI